MGIALKNQEIKKGIFQKLFLVVLALGTLGISSFPSLVQPTEKSHEPTGEAAFFRLEEEIIKDLPSNKLSY